MSYPSKLTPTLRREIRRQIKARTKVTKWTAVAQAHGISVRNLMAHIAAMRYEL